MASDGVNNLPADPGAGAEGADPIVEWRPRRRRRLELAPLHMVAGTSAADGGEQRVCITISSDSDASMEAEERSATAIKVAAPLLLLPGDSSPGAAAPPPVWFGSVALAGRRCKMEDTVSLHPYLCAWADGEPIHFFAVFDGHGGPHVAALCREQMHAILAEELSFALDLYLARRDEVGAEEQSWRAALARSFARVDALAPAACACGRAWRCACPLVSEKRGATVGSTVMVALLMRDRIVVANCGDSRAVLCRATRAVPLSEDHKPDRQDERARIEAAGGWLMYNGEARIRGILAISRSIGHEILKPEVISVPEITIAMKSDEDRCLILASDGLWDVISNKLACNIARQCLENGTSMGARAVGSGEASPSSGCGAPVAQQPESPSFRAAALLARLALTWESSDNISVVVIDLNVRG